ncbi:hypothetical protein V2J97_01120 [Pseudomonas alliivorans]|nr:hypothetical protein [Pseudomonas alliivorans]
MLKLLIATLNCFATIYLVGEKVRRNPKIDQALTILEGNYFKVNQHLENTTIKSGLVALSKFYGWICIVMFTVSTLALYVLPYQPLIIATSQGAFLSFALWHSIKWTLDHKKTFSENWKGHSIFIAIPMFLGIMDSLLGTHFCLALVQPLKSLMPFDWSRHVATLHPFFIGVICSWVSIFFFGIHYLLSWAILTPILILSVILVFIPVRLAKLLASIDRDYPFFWLAIFCWVGSFYYLCFG